MTAQPLTPAWYQPKPPFTVDTLFDLPESDLRYEVLEGQLVVSPSPTWAHNLAADRLRTLLSATLPKWLDTITNMAVRMPNGDGPIPDLLVATAVESGRERGVAANEVFTVVEVASPSSRSYDRVQKKSVYATGGIPCHWRVELRTWKEHIGPVPAIVVRILDSGEFSEFLFAAGERHSIPLAIGHGPELIAVELDPAELVGLPR